MRWGYAVGLFVILAIFAYSLGWMMGIAFLHRSCDIEGMEDGLAYAYDRIAQVQSALNGELYGEHKADLTAALYQTEEALRTLNELHEQVLRWCK